MGDIVSSNTSWIYFVVIFAGVIAYIAVMQRVETRRVMNKFAEGSIVFMSFGVNYYGLETEPGGPARSSGTLAFIKDGLYYRARHTRRELFIPGGTITNIEIIDQHKGKPLHQKVVGIIFLNQDGKVDRAAFRIPHPARWVDAIKTRFMSGEK